MTMTTATRSGIRAAWVATLSGLGAAVSALATPAAAQVLPAVPAAIEQLAFLVGDWAGSGWYEQAPGQRSEFEGVERVERRMGDRLIVVEGSFTAWMGPERGDVPVHQAFGIFAYDAAAGRITFRTYTARGAGGAARDVEVGNDRLVWSYDDPQLGAVRYTIEVADGTWRETGEASRDGTSWRQFFSMTLTRQ